jgi:L-iditol 2-dehydrogenase
VTFSYGAAPDDLRKAIELIDKDIIDVKKMVTHRVPLSDIKLGFRLVTEAKDSLKVVIVPD